MSFVTRIAPTPSGHLHRGNAYNFLLVWLVSRTHNGSIVLRIDDLDKGRYRPHFLESIFHDLQWMGIDWDKGPTSIDDAEEFSQHRRMDLYQKHLESLRSHPEIFGCSCTRKMIAQASTDGQYPGTCKGKEVSDGKVWRLWTKGEWGIVNNRKESLSSSVVLCNRQGIPSYMFACVIDDWLHDVDVIVRGNDLYQSSVTQSYLRSILGITREPFHIHHSLLVDKDGRKLSKSTSSLSLSALRDEGLTRVHLYRDFAKWRGWERVPTDIASLLDIFQNEDVFGAEFSVPKTG